MMGKVSIHKNEYRQNEAGARNIIGVLDFASDGLHHH